MHSHIKMMLSVNGITHAVAILDIMQAWTDKLLRQLFLFQTPTIYSACAYEFDLHQMHGI